MGSTSSSFIVHIPFDFSVRHVPQPLHGLIFLPDRAINSVLAPISEAAFNVLYKYFGVAF
jgi:hypothetical protein